MTKYFVFVLSLLLPLAVQAKITAEELNEVLQEHPEIVINAIYKYQEDQAKNKAENNSSDILHNNPDNIFAGNANADIVLVEFFDFSCGYCKKLAPIVKNVLKNNPSIKVIFKPVAFVSSISPYAAKASVAANNQGKFLEFCDAALSLSNKMSQKDIDTVAHSIGLDMERYYADINSDETNKIIEDISTLAHNLGVSGVPSLFLNGKVLEAYTGSEIEDAIKKAKQDSIPKDFH